MCIRDSPCTERKSRILWSIVSHPLSYLANSKLTLIAEKFAVLPNGLLMVLNETGQKAASAIDAAQPFVRRRNHTAYVLTYHWTNERQDTDPCAPDKPNGMRVKWNKPRRVQNADRSFARSVIPNCQYPESKSIVAKYREPRRLSSAS